MSRSNEIDDIRGFTILVMILIHTNTYYLSDKIAYTLVELSQFAVVAFIFCSSYLFYQKAVVPSSAKEFVLHMIKRVKRLLIPYYVFLVFHFLFLLIKESKKVTPLYIFQNITLTGGIEFNWLVLLFIELSVIMPLFHLWEKKNKPLLYTYIGIAIVSSIAFLKYTPLPWFRLIMWLPWSLVVIYTMYFDRMFKEKELFWGITSVALGIFLLTQQFVLLPLHHSFRMYANKYPPNLYHISYCIFAVNILFFLSKKGVFNFSRKIIHFFSVYSYSIYFIHILILYTFSTLYKIHPHWIIFYIFITTLTGGVQFVFNKCCGFLSFKKTTSLSR